jgi:hypothetical protein
MSAVHRVAFSSWFDGSKLVKMSLEDRECIGNIKGLLGGRVKPYGRLIALFAAGCAPLRGPSFRLDRPDGRKRVF